MIHKQKTKMIVPIKVVQLGNFDRRLGVGGGEGDSSNWMKRNNKYRITKFRMIAPIEVVQLVNFDGRRDIQGQWIEFEFRLN